MRCAAPRDEGMARFPHEWAGIGEAGQALKLLREHVAAMFFWRGASRVRSFSELKLDAKGMMLLPKVIAAARQGRRRAAAHACVVISRPRACAPSAWRRPRRGWSRRKARWAACSPSAEHTADIALAVKVVRALGALDVGQAAVVCEGLALAVEAAEGTDAMIARVGTLREACAARRQNVAACW